MKHLRTRATALIDSGAWLMIVIGLLLFATRLPFTAEGWFNLPLVASMLQVAGFMFTILGLQVMASILMWPGLNVGKLLRLAVGTDWQADQTRESAATILLGLMIFNGLSAVAFVIWVGSSFGGGIAGG